MRKLDFFIQKRRPGRKTQETKLNKQSQRWASEEGPRLRRCCRREAPTGLASVLQAELARPGGRAPPALERHGVEQHREAVRAAAAGWEGSARGAPGREGPRSFISSRIIRPKSLQGKRGAGGGGVTPPPPPLLKGG